MTEGREHFALDWLKEELDETLKTARQALESYADSTADETKLRTCLTALHQVHGTLLMLELTGVTVLSDEMEQLAQSMYGGLVDDMDAAQQFLMQGILQLPAHLEEIQKGLPDSRRSVLALANDIRMARGEEGFPDAVAQVEADVFAEPDDRALDRFDAIDGLEKARKIRGAYQQVLLTILKGKGSADTPAVLTKVAVGLERICDGTPMAVVWQAFGAYVGAVAQTETALSGEVVKLLRRIDAELKALATSGRDALQRPINKELVGTLVDGALALGSDSADLRQIGEALAQDAAERGTAVSGREAMQHAAGALREELAAIKNELDLFVRGQDRSLDGFSQLARPLKQIGSTLSILGFESSCAIVADQTAALDEGLESGTIDESILMGIAGALIQVDENLAGLARSRQSALAGTSEAAAIISDAHIAVLTEARNGLEETKHAVVDYITAQWDVGPLEAVPDLIEAVRGALAMVPLTKPAALLGQCASYVRTELLSGTKPEWDALDHFADAISGVDYYLERLSTESTPPGDDVLALVERSLAALGMTGTADPTGEPVLVEALAEDDPSALPTEAQAPEPEVPEPESPPEAQVDEVTDDAAVVAFPVSDPAADVTNEPAPPEEEEEEEKTGTQDPGFKLELVDDSASEQNLTDASTEDVDEPPSLDLAALEDDEERTPPVEAVEFSLDDESLDSLAEPAADEIAADEIAADEIAADEIGGPDETRSEEPAPDDPSVPLEFELEGTSSPAGEQPHLEPQPAAAGLTAVATSATNDTVEVPAPIGANAASASEADNDDEFDDEIVEIFVEEVEEVLENVDAWLPLWADGFDNEEALGEVRRAFHTLKGSGRIVGAQLIGELAWSVENLLNRIMDGTVDAHGQVATLVREARHLMPSLTEAFQNRQPVEGESIAAIMGRADVLASGGRVDELGAPVEIRESAAEENPEPPVSKVSQISEDAQEFTLVPQTDVEQASTDLPADASDELKEESKNESGDELSLEEAAPEPPGPEHAEDSHPPEVAGKLDDLIAALTTDSPVVAPVEAPDAESAEAALRETAAEAEAEAPAGPSVIETDPDVMALFEEEASRHLEILESRFNSEDDAAEVDLDEAVMRALHTLRGSSAMAGIDSVAGLAAPLYQVATAFKDAGATVNPDLFDFLQQGVFALRRCVDAVREGDVPDEDEALFETEARRILSDLEPGDAPGMASLLELESASVLLGVGEVLAAWRKGEIQADGLADVLAALHEVRNESQSREMDTLVDLCDGLIAGYQHLEGASLTEPVFAALDAAHDVLLDTFDCVAAGQSLPEVADVLEPLAAVFDEAAAKVIEFPAADDIVLEEFDAVEPAADTQPEETPTESVVPDAAVETLEPASTKAEAEAEAAPVRVARIPDDADQEILEIFFEEAGELLESIDDSVNEWLEERGNRVHLENLLRALHTLKGGARLAGLMDLGDETHALESFLIGVQNDETDPDDAFFATLHRHHDELATSVASLKAAAAGEVAEDDGIPTLGEVEADSADIEPVERVDYAALSEPEPTAESAAVVPLKPQSTEDSDGDPAVPQKGGKEPREMVRVGANLLEELVNLAGENSIIRSRIEQGINDFSISLEEMETTIERVREQLRRLEIETEAQVLFRHDHGTGPNYDEFDPLEMDRYSQLQQVARSLSETASDMLDLKETLAGKARESETLLIQQARINTELQEGLMRTRMVPFSRLLPRLRRIVRQVARDLGKEVEFHAYNAEGELDRNVLERMVPPLEHMLRNSVDHGIETPDVRSGFGKSGIGRIDLRLSRDAGDVVIEISDDGAGIDVENVRAKAVERGLMSEDTWMADEDILQFVLAPGFSTAKSVTQISGRGVGMDVVHSAVKQLGGSIEIMSTPGQGSRFTVRLPFTVSVNRALMVAVGDDTYAVPLNNIEGIVRVSTRELKDLMKPDGVGFEYAGVPYRVTYLGTYLGRDYGKRPDQASVPMVLMRSGDHALAVFVDRVQGSREIVVKSLGPQFAGVGGISGATILGDGSVVVILDLITLIRTQTANAKQAERKADRPRAQQDLHRPKCVMVVDDSVTVRKVTSRLLERQGMDVLVAKDGVEAVAMLQDRRPDIVLLDIEMPRMDGFEVARQIRHDEVLRDLPIVMISSRTGSKHQERAAELGVNRFLGKPFQENELLATIDELVESGD